MIEDKEKWKVQYDRMIRHKKYIEEAIYYIDIDKPKIEDHFFDFCIHCYHLKDWIENSSIGLNNEVNEYAKNSKYINICRGIGDHTKHFKLTSSERKNKPIRIQGIGIYDTTSTGGVRITCDNVNEEENPFSSLEDYNRDTIRIEINGEIYDMFEIVNKSISEWDVFIRGKSIN